MRTKFECYWLQFLSEKIKIPPPPSAQRDCLRLFFLLFLSKWSWRKSLSLVVIVSDVDLASCSSSLSIRDTLMGFPQNRRLFNQWKYLGANVNLTSNSDVKSWYSHSDLQCREPWKKSPPIQHFHCSTFRHCKLLFANLSRTNFSICYKLPQILKLLQISRRDCIFARAYRDISRCTCYLFVRVCSKCPPATHFGNFWSQDLDLSNYALQADMRSKYQRFCDSLEPGKAKK